MLMWATHDGFCADTIQLWQDMTGSNSQPGLWWLHQHCKSSSSHAKKNKLQLNNVDVHIVHITEIQNHIPSIGWMDLFTVFEMGNRYSITALFVFWLLLWHDNWGTPNGHNWCQQWETDGFNSKLKPNVCNKLDCIALCGPTRGDFAFQWSDWD